MPILSSIIEKDIAIDLGTDTTILYVAGIGIRLREPTVVTIDRTTGRVLKVGEDARKMLGRTPGNLVSVHPIAAGVISDYDMTCEMLREFIRRVTSFSLFRSRVLVCVPGSITGVEERAIVNAVIEAGGRKVYLVPSAVATAVGAGLDVNRADGHMIIDIGGGTTEAAVVSLNGVVESESIKTAGAAFDEAIVKYVRRKHNLLIGIRTAEELGYTVVGGINSDFFTLRSGVPNGISIEDGVYKSSPEGNSAIGFTNGRAYASYKPEVYITLENRTSGGSVTTTHLNKTRQLPVERPVHL